MKLTAHGTNTSSIRTGINSSLSISPTLTSRGRRQYSQKTRYVQKTAWTIQASHNHQRHQFLPTCDFLTGPLHDWLKALEFHYRNDEMAFSTPCRVPYSSPAHQTHRQERARPPDSWGKASYSRGNLQTNGIFHATSRGNMRPAKGTTSSTQAEGKVTLAPSHSATYFLAPPRDEAALFA